MSFKAKYENALSVLTAGLGEQVEYRPSSGGRYNLNAVFDTEYTALDPDTEQVISTNLPRIGVKLKDLASEPLKGDKVYIEGREFEIYDSQEDGQGGATLFLHKVGEDESFERTT